MCKRCKDFSFESDQDEAATGSKQDVLLKFKWKVIMLQ